MPWSTEILVDLRDRTYAAKTLVSLFFFGFFGSCLVFEFMQKPEVSEESEWRTHFFEGSTKIGNHFFQKNQEKNRQKNAVCFTNSDFGVFWDLLGALLLIVVELPNLAKCRRHGKPPKCRNDRTSLKKVTNPNKSVTNLTNLRMLECLPTACYSESFRKMLDVIWGPSIWLEHLLPMKSLSSDGKSGSTKNHPNPSKWSCILCKKLHHFASPVMLKRHTSKMLWALKRLGLSGIPGSDPPNPFDVCDVSDTHAERTGFMWWQPNLLSQLWSSQYSRVMCINQWKSLKKRQRWRR